MGFGTNGHPAGNGNGGGNGMAGKTDHVTDYTPLWPMVPGTRKISVTINGTQVEAEEGPVGLNAATGDLEDLVKAGVIDPAKVTRAALQNAASIAGLVLTTESLVADKPEPPAPAGAPGGDPMGGMGGMGMM